MTLAIVMMIILMSSLKSLPHRRHGAVAANNHSPSAPVPDSQSCTDTREPWISDERVSCFYSDEVKLKGIGSQTQLCSGQRKHGAQGCDLSKVCVNVGSCVSVTRWHGGDMVTPAPMSLVIIKTGGNAGPHRMMTLYMRRRVTIMASLASPPLPVSPALGNNVISTLFSSQSFNPGQTWHTSRITSPWARIWVPGIKVL